MIDKQPKNQSLVIAQPTQQLDQYDDRQKMNRQLLKKMKKGVDYGVIPGTDKIALLQPGAEKLAVLHTLIPKFEVTKEIEDWEKGFFYYSYVCKLSYNVPLTKVGEGGQLEIYDAKTVPAGEAERSCNSREKKYLYNVVADHFATPEEKAAAASKFTRQNKGYTNLYLRIKKTPDDLADVANTIKSMAQKRALVAAVRTATMASDIFLEEISDAEPEPTNQEKDFPRVNQIKKLHAVAHPRGFDEEKLHLTIEKLYKVDSITKLTGAQIDELTGKLELTFEVVGEGNSPKRISGEGESIVKAAEEIFEGKVEPAEEGEVAKQNPFKGQKCAQCKKKPARKNGFCSPECQDLYYPPDKGKPSIETMQQKLKEMGKGEATP